MVNPFFLSKWKLDPNYDNKSDLKTPDSHWYTCHKDQVKKYEIMTESTIH